MHVKEVANLVGISVRTLHYYDQIDLLVPETITESGYRVYSEANLERLQQILFFKELGFSLKVIQTMLDHHKFNRLEALEVQRKALMKKRNNLDKMIRTIEKTINYEKGEIDMTTEEKFNGFDFDNNEYEAEARARWGDKAVDASQERINRMDKEEKWEMEEKFTDIFQKLSAIRHLDPAGEAAQAGIKDWWELLNQIGDYSLEAFQGLGEMYVTDERFTKNIDQYGDGLAAFMRDAMQAFVKKNK